MPNKYQKKQAAKTAGHAARRQIDLNYSRQRRQDARQERAGEEKFKGRLPVWGGRNPYTGDYEFRPGAKEGFWENRSTDWTGQERGAAEGAAEWTKIQHPLVKRQPNSGFGYFGGKAVDAIGGALQHRGQNQPQPQIQVRQRQQLPMPQQQVPNRARVIPNAPQPGPKPHSGQPAGPGLPSGTLGLPSGVPGLPAPGGSPRQPGASRRLPSNTGRPALGTGAPALGAGSPYPDAIEATASDTPAATPRRKAGMGNWGKDRIAAELEGTPEIVSPTPKKRKAAGLPLQTMGNPWGEGDPERLPGTPLQTIGNPWAYDPPRLMQLFFAGAEVASHLAVLRQCGVTRVAVNITNLARNCQNLEGWATRERLGGLEWVLYADAPQVPAGPALEVLKGAQVQPEIVTGPISWYEGTWLSNTDLLFLPIWDATDPTILRDFTENYDGVTLPDSVVDNPVAVRQARASIKRLGQLAALTGRSKGIERFDTLVSSAWWAVQKYGETQVWAANRLVRLNAEDKRNKRERYAPAIEAMGIDMDKIYLDDPTETVTLAVRSWQALEQHLTSSPRAPALIPDQIVTNGHSRPVRPTPDTPPSGVDNGGLSTRHLVLPVIGVTRHGVTGHDEDGNEFEDSVNTINVTPESLRQCNSCALALTCPSHYPGAACSYQIPVEIKTKVQLVNVLRAVTEIQTQRVLMGRFAEEIQGEPNPDLGKEMDRLFAMVERWRTIEDTRDSLKITVDAKGDAKAGMGVLSRLFGDKVGRNAVLLEEPLDSNEIMEEMAED